MRHIYYAITICTAASLGLGFGQDIPTDTFKALAEEWKTPATTLNCLTALRLYTTYTVKEGDVFLSPADATKAALKELLKDPLDKDREDLYTVAQKQPEFLDWLARANGLETAQEDTLFGNVEKLIGTIYGSPKGKQALAAVQESSAQKNNYLAIFQLLDAYPKNTSSDQYANSLETIRACYKMKSDRLFKLVADKIVPAKK